MKQVMKTAGYMMTACALTFSLSSCGNKTTSSTTTSDSSANAITIDTSAHPAADTVAMNKSTNTDSSFVVDAAKNNGQEIQMLEAGAEQGSNKKLKATAKKMLADHKKLNDALTDYASKKSITLSSDTSADMSAMNGESEVAFDTAWTQKMIAGHQETIAKFEAAQNSVKDADLKTLITNTLPTLRMHLDMCQSIMTSMKK